MIIIYIVALLKTNYRICIFVVDIIIPIFILMIVLTDSIRPMEELTSRIN